MQNTYHLIGPFFRNWLPGRTAHRNGFVCPANTFQALLWSSLRFLDLNSASRSRHFLTYMRCLQIEMCEHEHIEHSTCLKSQRAARKFPNKLFHDMQRTAQTNSSTCCFLTLLCSSISRLSYLVKRWQQPHGAFSAYIMRPSCLQLRGHLLRLLRVATPQVS